MGWVKYRDRLTRNVDRETKKIDAEFKRIVNRVTTSPDRAFNGVIAVAPAPYSGSEPLKALSLPVSHHSAAENSENSASGTQPPVTNPLHLKPGLAFVINHNTFEERMQLSERTGSFNDIENIEKVCEYFQIPCRTVQDGTLLDVRRIMAELEQFDFSQYACIIIFIMSHGYENDVIAAKDGNYPLNKEVLYPILRNNTLLGKTKLLFIQSCKGLTDLTLVEDAKLIGGQPTIKPDEILQLNSCVEGYCSYRHKGSGSIFIQILCEKLTELGDTEDIQKICKEVIVTLKKEFADMQIPMIHTNAIKSFVLGHYRT